VNKAARRGAANIPSMANAKSKPRVVPAQDIVALAASWQARGAEIHNGLVAERDQLLSRVAVIDGMLSRLGTGGPSQLKKPAARAEPASAATTKARTPRRKGIVSVSAYGKRFRHQLRRDGKSYGAVFDTRAEAERDLAKKLKELDGAAARPVVAVDDDEEDDPEPSERDPLLGLMPTAPTRESAVGFTHPGPGWGEIDGNGIVKHLLCNGKGNIPDSSKKRGKTWCQPCGGEGYRRALSSGVRSSAA